MEKDSSILVTGVTGTVGSVFARALRNRGYSHVLTPNRKELDLTDGHRVDAYFAARKIDHVFMLAAKVGGIAANVADPVGFLTENLRIQTNLFEAAHKHKTFKNLFLGSSCVYPRECPQPMKEEYLLTGQVEPTNEGYALAKIAGLKSAQYYHKQYGTLTVCPMPCNIYGTNDHYDFERSHVLSALVRRFVDAKDQHAEAVTLWGTGSARREFIHVDDVVDAMFLAMEKVQTPDIINIGTGSDISIGDLARLIARLVGFSGELRWDSSKPDGMPRKCLDTTRMKQIGFAPRIGLDEGIGRTIAEYRELKRTGNLPWLKS